MILIKGSSLFYTLFLITLMSLRVASHIKCNIYPYSAQDCIQKTEGIRCQYNYFDNTCRNKEETRLGCSENLNKEACLSQLTDGKQNRVQCLFQQKCTYAKLVQLQHYGCSGMFNKYACLNVENYLCTWQNNKCQTLTQTIEGNSGLCNIFKTPVNAFTCTQLPSGLCISSGYEGDFQCLELNQKQLSYLSCYELGLNEEACLAINKENQYCIFQDNKCREIKFSEIKQCDHKFSKFLCLQIKNKDIQCEWVDQKCRKFQSNSEFQCVTKNLVNVSVCQLSTGLCKYDEEKHKCIEIEQTKINEIQCDTPGLSRLACLSIKNQLCSFVKGKCQELSELDLNFYQCNMGLNKLACINIKTPFQYCFWNGKNCERRIINQDYDCPLQIDNKYLKVNGNVCQAISKYNIRCKYNQQTNLCVEGSSYDGCDTPYLNKFGCQSIIKNDVTCQWTTQGCKYIQVIQHQTTCASLGNANPIACSQVLEYNQNVGCYFDILKQTCVTLIVKLDPYTPKNEVLQYQKDQEFLKNINCSEPYQGINRITCSSIRTMDVACMWKKDQCVQIENIHKISTIPCLHLQYANALACAYVTYKGEVCRYNEQARGCVNSLSPRLQCNELGLNAYGCMKAEGKCQFVNEQCLDPQKLKQLEQNQSLIIENIPQSAASCGSTFPTKKVCVSFTDISLLCQWRRQNGFCEPVEVVINQYCLDYGNKDISVNPNVCASILCDFADYDYKQGPSIDQYRGYCYFNKVKANCQIKREICNTKCCTEIDNIGINAHSCSKFSSNEPGVYCFFKDLRCQELTNQIVDISNPKLVKSFYNENKLPCSSMNINSCHMIDWSKQQLCYHNGIICQNINFGYYKNYRIFIEEPSILNEYACYAIDGQITQFNTLKYIGYDDVNKRCKELLLNPEYKYPNCESAKGNRNVCQRYSGNNYCKWDQIQLKCVTIPLDEFYEIQQCDSTLNSFACSNLKNMNCIFSYQVDKCIKFNDSNVDCNNFQSLGMVTKQVCQQINKIGQKCQFNNGQCFNSTNYTYNCNGLIGNNRFCLSNTGGLCRWDTNTLTCYTNYTKIDMLSCSDQINIQLCKRITKEPCIWNDLSNQCEVYENTSAKDFEILNTTGNYKLNEKACLSLIGEAYYFQRSSYDCIKLKSKNVSCDHYLLNKYACLYHTQTNNCFYDEEEVVNRKCKYFVSDLLTSYRFEQTICQTKFQINIEVCMNIQRHCIFDVNTLQCLSFEFEDTMTCTFLSKLSNNLKHPNKRVCSSVVQTLEETSAELNNSAEQQTLQQCYFEKYCFWINYSCQIFPLVYEEQTNQDCPDFEIIDTCFDDIINDDSYGKRMQLNTEINWVPFNETCSNKIIKYYRQHEYYQLSDNIIACKIHECSMIEELICNIHEIIETFIPIDEVTPNNYDSSTYENKIINDVQDTCENLDCSKLNEYTCEIEKSKCLKEKNCRMNLEFPYSQVIKNDCIRQEKIVLSHRRILNENRVNGCSKSFSKAICLELSSKCYYDPEQGGCMQLEGNENMIGDCSQIANNCYVSSSHKAICQNGEVSIKPGDKCKTVQKPYIPCIPLTKYQQPYICSDILASDAQPILCAKASDYCRYDGKACVSSIPKEYLSNNYYYYPCEKSFSKSMCQKCSCDYDYAGYCQQHSWPPQINLDRSNQYSLCYQVNLLDTTNKLKICISVSQTCIYIDGYCYDATNLSCNDDLFEHPVSYVACKKCQEYATKYDYSLNKCLKIDDIPNPNTCDHYINQKACITKTEGSKCYWWYWHCYYYQGNNSECTMLNSDACITYQYNICWIDQTTSLCVNYDPYQGKCDLLKTEKLCITSMYENCLWADNTCIKNNELPTNTCDNLQKYQCLHALNIACGWSDYNKKCYKLEFRSDPYDCNYILLSDFHGFINSYNSYTCTQIKIKSGCLYDQQQYKCREVIVTDILSCEESSISSINEYSCLYLAKGNCKFVDYVCQKTIESNLGCQPYLNQNACLIQEAACKFDNYCQSYEITDKSQINTVFPYTSSICKPVNFIIGLCLIYSEAQKKCLDITNKNIWIQGCSHIGMNKYTCLLKTNQYCEYVENECRELDIKVIQSLKTCKSTLNQYACTKLEVQCKYLNYQCLPISDNDNCITLSKEKSIVSSISCLHDSQNPCKFDDITQNCQYITTPQQCNGLNKKACIFFTQGSHCEFKGSKCITSFGNPNCLSDINQDKCFSIINKGDICYFHKNLGCQNIDTTQVNIYKCLKGVLQTNPSICQKSTDIPCFYDKKSQKCIQYTEQNQNSYLENYSMSNIYSFNKGTCQIFNQQKALRWKQSCQIVRSGQLIYLKCNDLLNKIACLSIKTPFQFCQYKNNKCIKANLDDYKNVSCDQIKDINSGVFCAMNKNQIPCEFNKSLFKCQVVDSPTIRCVEKDPEEKGFNQNSCEMNQSNCIFDENCYYKNNSGFQFCRDIQVNGQYQCKQVTGEGCMIESNNCKKIYYQDYLNIKCEQAVNRFGCVNIQTEHQYCQFDGDQCKLQDVAYYKEVGCLSIININNYVFCEQAKDIACTFDLKNNACRNVYTSEEFECERGLNKIACLYYTDKSLMCKFFEYCYGPNDGMINCTYNDKDICCREADSIDTCLNQKLYECEWTGDECQGSKNQVEICDDIINSSFLVCVSIKNTMCVFVPSLYKCQSQKFTTCSVSQIDSQCKRMKSQACIWKQDEETCNYTEESAYLGCSQVNEKSGNQRACMNVQLEGQQCMFKDESCVLFVQQENSNNCLDTINWNACMYQTISDCEWIYQVYTVRKYQQLDEENIIQGECMPITNLDQKSCSSNLSYTACLKITKTGQYCIWKDLKCQTIKEQQLYTPDELTYINSNVCSLVNNGDIVMYDEELRKCVKIENSDELTCVPAILGINREACLAIKNQSCIWNNVEKRCQQYNNLVESESCEKPDWNIKTCQQHNINQPCGYSIKGCQIVDITKITCTHPGLNKFACLNIQNHPCIWKLNGKNDNYYCDDYIPYTSCKLVPINVSVKVCQLVDQDTCFYDMNYNKCENNTLSNINCDTLGLNMIGCIEIDGCVFQEYCQSVKSKFYNCNEYPVANYKVCMNAIDRCKFNELTSGCSQANEELCDAKGLSEQGCNQSKCTYKNNQCFCNSIKDKDCNQIMEIEQCNSLDHCVYSKEQNQCKWRQCEDKSYNNCDGLYINQQQCEDIHNPISQICPKINNQLCIYNQELNQCQLFKCEAQSQYEQCQNYPNCHWIKSNEQSFCTDIPCRYQQNTIQCSGIQIKKEICVELSDSTCVSCEEILSPCICLQNNEYCDYNFKEMTCYSKICQNYKKKEDCPTQHCYFNQTCMLNCELLKQPDQCQNNQCLWNNNKCKQEVTIITNPIITDYGELIDILLMSILILSI